MNSTQISKITVMLSLGFIGLFYQNFDFSKDIETLLTKIPRVHEESRSAHAKELLGQKYYGSYASMAEKIENLHFDLYTEVEKNLPAKYKKSAFQLTETIIDEAYAQNLDPVFVVAVIKTESKFNPKTKGQFGEIGLMQVKPTTAKWIAEKNKIKWEGDKALYNPIKNVKYGIAYFAHLRNTFNNYANKYLSAYNMGPRNVRKLYRNSIKPHEYSLKVMKNYKETYFKMVSNKYFVMSEIVAD